MKRLKTVTIKNLRVNPDHLYVDACANMIANDPTRFDLEEGKPLTTGTMYFFTTYLEAKLFMAAKGTKTLYVDESLVDERWVVVTPEDISKAL